MSKNFKLSESFTSVFAQKASADKRENSHSLEKGSFKLNPKSAATLGDVPVEVLKKKSKSKLQSLKDDDNTKKFSIFESKVETAEVIKEKKTILKKYNLGAGEFEKPKATEQSKPKQTELPYDVVRPNRLQNLNVENKNEKGIASSTLFQTPLLPCFASEFRANLTAALATNEFKTLEEKEGLWKIGKIKLKGNQATLEIGGIEFQATKADVSGRAGVVGEEKFYQLPNWKSLWVVQPSEQLYN